MKKASHILAKAQHHNPFKDIFSSYSLNSQESSHAILKLKELLDLMYPLGDQKCHDMKKEYVACGDPTGCGLGNAAKAWDWQFCTQLGMPNSSKGMFYPEKYSESDLGR